MNEMASAEFRKRFARLTETTVVTVHGHAIGTWTPATVGLAAENEPAVRAVFTTQVVNGREPNIEKAVRDAPPGGPGFGRPRPAPKPRSGR